MEILLNNYVIVDTDKIINICLEFTDDVYIGPDIVKLEETLEETDGMVFSPVKVRRAKHDMESVFLYETVVAVKMNADYLSDLGNKLAKYMLAVKQCVANREGECVVKFVQLSDTDLDDPLLN
jgi:hypothetical protein